MLMMMLLLMMMMMMMMMMMIEPLLHRDFPSIVPRNITPVDCPDNKM